LENKVATTRFRLARTLLDHLGPGQTALLYHELAALLRGQPAGETKRKMPARRPPYHPQRHAAFGFFLPS
jgi:hypothetical protein